MDSTGPSLEKLQDSYSPEPLDPDLVPCIENTGMFRSLRHPLVYIVPYAEPMNKMANQAYRQKRAITEKVLAEGKTTAEFTKYVFLHERPYRFEALARVADRMEAGDYWELLGEVWSDTENLWQVLPLATRLLGDPRPGRQRMMDDSERLLLSRLPDEFTVFRGHDSHNPYGCSWTLAYGVACWFRDRFSQGKRGRVTQATVRKVDVVAVLLGRNEVEIVVESTNVLLHRRRFSPPRKYPQLARIARQATDQFRLVGRTDHGPDHWEKVDYNGVELCLRTPDADLAVVRRFAWLHDSQRTNEMDDPQHGERAAAYCRTLGAKGLGLSKGQLDVLCEACASHEQGLVSDDPTIGACWDADRLDLVRVGILPDEDLLSTDAGKRLRLRI